jgi:hypothetical protein
MSGNRCAGCRWFAVAGWRVEWVGLFVVVQVVKRAMTWRWSEGGVQVGEGGVVGVPSWEPGGRVVAASGVSFRSPQTSTGRVRPWSSSCWVAQVRAVVASAARWARA